MTPDTAGELARRLAPDLTEWQLKWLDEVLAHAANGERPVYRFLGRKIGYGWAWEKADDGT